MKDTMIGGKTDAATAAKLEKIAAKLDRSKIWVIEALIKKVDMKDLRDAFADSEM